MGPPKEKGHKAHLFLYLGEKSFGTFKNTNEKVWCCWGLGHTGLENSWCRPVRLWLLRKNMHFPTGWRPVAGGCCKEVVATKTSLVISRLPWSPVVFVKAADLPANTPDFLSLWRKPESENICFQSKNLCILLQQTHYKRRNFYFENGSSLCCTFHSFTITWWNWWLASVVDELASSLQVKAWFRLLPGIFAEPTTQPT